MQNRYLAFFLEFELNTVISRKWLLVIVNVEEDLVGDLLVTKGLTFAHSLVVFTPVALTDYRGHTHHLFCSKNSGCRSGLLFSGKLYQ
jgi:hypothetical protein